MFNFWVKDIVLMAEKSFKNYLLGFSVLMAELELSWSM